AQLRPAGVVIKVPGDQRDIDVAALPDRLAVVEAFEHREKPRMLLHLAGDGIEIFAALKARERRPALERRARRLDRLVDIGRSAAAQFRQHLAVRWIGGGECLPRGGPFAIDEMAEPSTMRSKPVERRLRALGRGTVFQRLEDFCDLVHVIPGAYRTSPSTGLSMRSSAGPEPSW